MQHRELNMALFDVQKFMSADDGNFEKIPAGEYLCRLLRWKIGPSPNSESIKNKSSMQWKIEDDTSNYNGQVIFLDHILDATYDNFDPERQYSFFRQAVKKLGFNVEEFSNSHEDLLPEAIGTAAIIAVVASKKVNQKGEPYLNPRIKEITEYAYNDVSSFVKGVAPPISEDDAKTLGEELVSKLQLGSQDVLSVALEVDKDTLSVGTIVTASYSTTEFTPVIEITGTVTEANESTVVIQAMDPRTEEEATFTCKKENVKKAIG